MDTTTLNSMCRCCAAEGMFKDIKTSYHWMGEEEVYGDMLRECFDVKLVSVEDGGICEVCITQLRNASNFKKQVLHTEKKFKRILDSRQFKPTEVKEEVSGDENSSSEDNENDRDVDNDNIDDEDYVPDFEMPIKTESPEESKSRKRGAKATTSRAKKSRVADDEDKSVGIRGNKSIKSELENSWGVTIVRVKGSKPDECPTKNDAVEPKRSQSKIYLNKKTKSLISNIEGTKVKTSRSINVIEQVTVASSKAVKDDVTPDTSKLGHSAFTKNTPQKSKETPLEKIIINPPPDLNITKQLKTKKSKTCHRVSKETNKNKTTKKEPQPNVNPIPRMKIIPPPDMDFMMELDKHRFNIRTVMQYSNATPIRNHVRSGFVCCFCDAHFPKPADLKIHTIQSHDEDSRDKFFRKKAVLYSFMVKLDITSLTCNICNMSADTLDQLIDHLNDAHQKGLHKDIKSHIVCFKFGGDVMRCLMCPLEFNSFKLLSEHMNQHYTNFVCDECGAGFINRRQLLLHSDKHKDGAHKCGTCDKVFPSLKKMKTHERVTHVYSSGIRCNHCNEKFKNKKATTDHMAEVHGT